MDSREVLLKWCQRKTLGYDDCNVTDLGQSWRDGMAFCAILHQQHVIGVWDYADLEKQNAVQNIVFALETAEEELGITPCVTAAEIESGDERKIGPYLAEWYRFFKEESGELEDSETGVEEDLRDLVAQIATSSKTKQQKALPKSPRTLPSSHKSPLPSPKPSPSVSPRVAKKLPMPQKKNAVPSSSTMAQSGML